MAKIKVQKTETLAEVFSLFILSKKAQGITDKTVNSYLQHFRAISKHLNTDLDISELSSKDLEQMIHSMRQSELSPNSIRSYTITMKAFLSWCNTNSITTLNISLYKGEEIIKETYSDDELKVLLKKPNMRKCDFSEYRSWAIINFLVNSGSRAATIRNIKLCDLDLNNCLIYARHTKNKRALAIPLCSELICVLREYLQIRGGEQEDYLFCNESGQQLTESALRSSIARYNHRRGIRKTSIHLFRHTFARKYLVDCGGDAFTLQRLLGHSTLDMTKHYCAIFDADITRNFDKFSPLAQIRNTNSKIRVGKR